MSLSNAILNDSKRPPPAPIEFAGEWVAWSHDRTKIVAHGDDLEAVYDAAVAAGHPNSVFQKVPEAGVDFIGGIMKEATDLRSRSKSCRAC
jgi:hypothetical protein